MEFLDESAKAEIGFPVTRVEPPDLHESLSRLQKAGIQSRDLGGNPTDEPVVLAWMPAAAIYFRDPDNNLLEFIAMLPNEPRPDRGALPWTDWTRRKTLSSSVR